MLSLQWQAKRSSNAKDALEQQLKNKEGHSRREQEGINTQADRWLNKKK